MNHMKHRDRYAQGDFMTPECFGLNTDAIRYWRTYICDDKRFGPADKVPCRKLKLKLIRGFLLGAGFESQLRDRFITDDFGNLVKMDRGARMFWTVCDKKPYIW